MDRAAADYDRIERAILELDERWEEQPGLGELAERAGLSPAHFQRVFRRWAGISPKRFLQYATAAHVRARLSESRNLLGVAYQAGLSGPGRLHDLVVAVHAVTPAELRSGGAGVEVLWGLHATPFGRCLIGLTGRGICRLTFVGEAGEAAALAELRAEWPAATLREEAVRTGEAVRTAFGRGNGRPPALHLRGTNFQLRVWDALLRIPPGALVSYEAVAQAVGSSAAVRAVGSAIGRNPVAWLIPCHRVIRKTGAFGGYRWGLARKRLMHAWERTNPL